jgi:hypothetical protein
MPFHHRAANHRNKLPGFKLTNVELPIITKSPQVDPANQAQVLMTHQGIFRPVIPVVINMFRLPDFLTSEMVVCNGLKLLERLHQAILEVIDNPEKTQ